MAAPLLACKRAPLAERKVPDVEEDDALSTMDRRVKSPWITRGRLWIVAVLLVVATTLGVAYLKVGIGRTLAVSTERLTMSPVHEATFLEYIPVTASVIPRNTAYLDAIEGGQVAEVLVEEGVHVTVGQPLVRLKNTNLELEVLGREAQLNEQLDRLSATKLSFEQTRLTHQRELIDLESTNEQLARRLQRLKALQPSGSVARAEVDDGVTSIERGRRLREALAEALAQDDKAQREQIAQMDQAMASMKKNLTMARDNLNNLLVKAPFAGQLTALDAHLGESKAPGQRIGQIDEIDSFKVSALVDEFYVSRVAVGEHADVDIEGVTHRLELSKVYPQIEQRQFKVDLLFASDQPRAIRRGQTLQLRLEIGSAAKSLVVANGPFYEDTGGQWAFVVLPSGAAAERRLIRLGRRNPDDVEILSGLAAGERVITSEYESLQKFDRIRLVN